jgi:hypothetical protein
VAPAPAEALAPVVPARAVAMPVVPVVDRAVATAAARAEAQAAVRAEAQAAVRGGPEVGAAQEWAGAVRTSVAPVAVVAT